MHVAKLASKCAEYLATLNAGQGISKVAYAQKEVCSGPTVARNAMQPLTAARHHRTSNDEKQGL